MINLKERKLQLEVLIASLQEELASVNEQLQKEILPIEDGTQTNSNGTTCKIDGEFIQLKNNEVELNYFFDSLYTSSKKYVKRGSGEINCKFLEEANPANQWKAQGRKRLTEKEYEAIQKLENELKSFGLSI